MQGLRSAPARARARPFVIFGNPENRRVGLFQAELRARDLPEARVVSYLEIARNPKALQALAGHECWLRLESPGENAELYGVLLDLGYQAAKDLDCTSIRPEKRQERDYLRGQLLCPRQLHLGFAELLRRIEEFFREQHPPWHLTGEFAAIATLFDKRACAAIWQREGIAIPEFLPDLRTPEALRREVQTHSWSSVFVKVSCSSSASGLAMYFPGSTERLMTTIERSGGSYFNSLKVRRYDRQEHVEELLDYLLREGAQVERNIPKARLPDGFFDLRVVTIAGEPRFVLPRQSRHPITNLHLGGWRGDVQAVRERLGEHDWQAMMHSCRNAARCFRKHVIGVDVMVEKDWKHHRVIEANAFGDLLPGLVNDGRTVYGWQIDDLNERARRGVDAFVP